MLALKSSRIAQAPTHLPFKESSKELLRVEGLDSIRFLAALSVAIDHLRPISFFNLTEQSADWVRILSGVLGGWWFSGPSAVIVFFVISGFCIHLPHRDGAKFGLLEFYSRRILRLLLPLPAAFLLAFPAQVQFGLFSESILWSLTAELVYYFLYPFLLKIQKSIGWKPLVGITFCLAFAVILSKPSAKNYPSFGFELNWLVGLPCWLMGCYLAEIWDKKSFSKISIWTWRLSILSLIMVFMLLRHHTAIGYPYTLNFFAIAVSYWLLREIGFYNGGQSKPWRVLEWCGKWSYSLYLVHLQVGGMLILAGLRTNRGALEGIFFYGVLLLFTYIFYWAVEKPSYRIAKVIARKTRRPFKVQEPSIS